MDKSEIPAHGGNREREQAEKTALAGASSFLPQHTTSGGPIASILSGTDNPLTGQEIMAALRLSDPRTVTRLIERERRAGLPICASNDTRKPGYFWPSTVKELDAYIGSLHHRHRAISATIEGLERARDAWTGQTRLDLNDQMGGEGE